jgi:hypothetical protein
MGFQAGGGSAGSPGGGKLYYHSSDNGKTWEDGRSSWTENPPTKVEVEKPKEDNKDSDAKKEERAAGEKPQMERPEKQATHDADPQKDHGSQAAYGDYADLGPAPPPAKFGEDTTEKASTYHYASHPSQLYGDLHEGPYNFGNPADPTVNENPTSENPVAKDGTLTYSTGPAETNLDNGARLEMFGTLQNTGNPLDNSVNETPAPGPPSTGDAERNTLDP